MSENDWLILRTGAGRPRLKLSWKQAKRELAAAGIDIDRTRIHFGFPVHARGMLYRHRRFVGYYGSPLMEITRDDAVAVFQAIGMKSADSWNRKKLAEKLRSIHELVDETTSCDDEDLDEKLDDLVAAAGAGQEIKIVRKYSDPVPAPAAEDEADDEDDFDEEEECPEDDEEEEDEVDEDEDEDEEPEAKKPAKKKSPKKASKPTKAAKKSPKKSKAAKASSNGKEPSNKQKVYAIYARIKGDRDPKTIYEKLVKESGVGDAVKETTVKTWVSQWNHGKHLPAGVEA